MTFAKGNISGLLRLAGVVVLSAGLGTGADTNPPPQPLTADPGWPRVLSDGSAKLLLYQPQVDNWKDFKILSTRFAVELTPAAGNPPVYGTLRIDADSSVDLETRSVLLTNIRLVNARYASAKDEAQAKAWTALTVKLIPKRAMTVALDRLLAYLDSSQVQRRDVQVALDPPPILVSMQPAVLVILDGQPLWVDVDKTKLKHAVNTNWDLFQDADSGLHYLRLDKSWLAARSLQDTWTPIMQLPKDFAQLPKDAEYQEIRESAAAPNALEKAPQVFLVYKPSELIVLNGSPTWEPVRGTQLMWVSNTESDLFFCTTDRSYYFLTSGRWFRNGDLKGSQWEAATTSLPADFSKIPPDHPRAHVLAAVPGTREAEQAIVEASIPQTATLSRKDAKASVNYVGEPKFESIPGTSIAYAANTPNDVLKVGDLYYLCLQGVWFVSTTPKGPWEVADKVPPEVYTIPPTSPKYNVTYVNVYESTPETVTYGYTAGYLGMCVGFGVAMWGTGYYYPPYYAWGPYPIYWPSPYYTYGMSAWYNPATGMYGRGSAVYGPYGGFGRAAAYNPQTGAYAWGRAAWGPYGAAASGGFYNPSTGRWGGTYQATNGYQSWGHSVVGTGSDWARAAHVSGARGAVGVAETSAGGKAIAVRGGESQGFAAKSGSGDFYAGKDGNVYKRDESGSWYKRDNGSWNPVEKPPTSSGQAERGQERTAQRESGQRETGQASSQLARPEDRAAGARPDVGQLSQDAAARSRGNINAERANTTRQMPGRGPSGGFAARPGRVGRR